MDELINNKHYKHFIPLYKWITDKDGDLMVDYLIEQKTLNEDIKRIFSLFGIKYNVDVKNQTINKEKINPDCKTLFNKYYIEKLILI